MARQRMNEESMEMRRKAKEALRKKIDESYDFCIPALDTEEGEMLMSGEIELGVEASTQLSMEGPHIKAVKKLLHLFDKHPTEDSLEEWLERPWDEEAAELWFEMQKNRSTAETLHFMLDQDNVIAFNEKEWKMQSVDTSNVTCTVISQTGLVREVTVPDEMLLYQLAQEEPGVRVIVDFETGELIDIDDLGLDTESDVDNWSRD